MRRILIVIVSCAILLSISRPVCAQQPTGTPNFNSFQGIPGGVINLGTLGVHLNVPIFKKAGRGTPMAANWNYDDGIWYTISGGNWETGVAPNYTPSIGFVGTQVTAGSPAKYNVVGNPWCSATGSHATYEWYGFTYTDNSGTSHIFPNATLWYPNCGSLGQTATDTTADGYTLSAAVNINNWAVTTTVTAPDGTVFNGTCCTGSGTLTNRNGNQIKVSNGVFTDTLNTTALTISSGTTFTYTGEGGNESVTETTTNYYIATDFAGGCSGTHDYVSSSTYAVPTKFSLPDGSSYVLTWEQTPNKSTSYITGRIRSITLPTGGTITFTYTGSNYGMNCDGTTSNMTMATPDGTWTYTHTAPNSANVATTTVTDPAQNVSKYNFYVNSSLGALEAQRQVYTGSSSLLETIITCYNGQSPSTCTTAPSTITTVSQITHYVELPDSSGVESKTDEYYDGSQRLTKRYSYDFGAGQPGNLLREITYEYGSYDPPHNSVDPLGGNILDLLGRVTTYNGGGAFVTAQAYQRDTKGNLTGFWQNDGSTNLEKTYTYYSNGTVETFTDWNGDSYSYTYGDCSSSFPTQITEVGAGGSPTLSRSMTWDCNGAVMKSFVDESGASTTIDHSGEYFWRPDYIQDAMGNSTSFSYSPTTYESTLSFNSGASTVDKLITLDSLGRVHVSQQRQGPGSPYFDTVETDYNSDGQVSRVTMPWQGVAGATNAQASATTYTYDGMGRVLTATDGGNGEIQYAYAQNTFSKTLLPTPSGETSKSTDYQYDGLERVINVCEGTNGTGGGTCSFSGWSGYLTQYAYDALGDLTGVTQNAQSGGTPQTRSFAYDAMGRLTSETNPESGKTSYAYDTQMAGELYSRTDENNVTVVYTHGAFHRVTSACTGTFCRNFLYDSGNAYSGISNPTLVNGRLAEAYTTGGSGPGGGSLLQKAASTSCSGTSCTLTVAATGANHLLTVVAGFASNVSISSVTGGGSWVCPSSAVAANGTALGSAACYVLSSTSGVTSITINLTGSPGSGIWVAEFREYSVSGTPSFDTAGAASDPTCTSCAGVSLTLNGTNDLIVQMINPSYMASGVSSGWTDTDFPGNDFGVADEIGTSSGAAPTWTTTSGIATASALAFNLGTAQSVLSAEYFGYDADGHTTDLWESTPDSGGLYHVTDQYFANGVVNTLVAENSSGSLFTGLPTFTYGVDGEGRPTTVLAGSGQNPVTAASYYTVSQNGQSAGQLASLTFGSGDSDTYSYDPATGRMTQYQFSINGSNVTGALSWHPNGTLQTLAITDPFNSSDTQTCSYLYDPMLRISQANCGSTWGQNFSYDAYGNVTKTVMSGDGGLNWQPGYNNNNQYNLGGVSYDNDGNLLNDSFHTYTWDAFGSLTSIDGNPQYHDAFGRLVEWKDASGTTYETMYSPAGAKIGMMTGQTLAVGRIPLPGGAIASYGPSGLNNYAHADFLGSTRLSSYTNRTVKWDLAHAPYGEVYALTGGGAEFTFTGQYSDYGTTNTLWDFPLREYHSSQGRWISPDPAGLAAVNPMNPQTWNRYAYVAGNPLVYTDPTGLFIYVGPSRGPSTSDGSVDDGTPPNDLFFCDFLGYCPDSVATQPNVTGHDPGPPILRRSCPAVPPHPANADVNSNIALTNFVYYANWLNPPTQTAFTDAWLVSMVRPNGPWDYKTQGQQYDAFGNFNFGATGAAAGIPLQALQTGAGAVSTLVGTNSAQYGSWYQPPLYGHPPIKSQMIAAGYAYYKQGCNKKD